MCAKIIRILQLTAELEFTYDVVFYMKVDPKSNLLQITLIVIKAEAL